MKAYEIGPQTGLDGLAAVTRPDPVPGFGEAVVKVETICLNHRDIMVLEGRYGPRRPPERVPMSEGFGVVIEVDVENFCRHFGGGFERIRFERVTDAFGQIGDR